VSQLAQYKHLHALASRQLEVIQADDLDSFGALSAERDALVASLKAPADPVSRAELARVARSVLQLDAQIQRALRSSMESTRNELGQLRQGHRAMRAYAAPVSTQGIGGRA
jgi:hypothetical protein